MSDIAKKINRIQAQKEEANRIYKNASENIRNSVTDIKRNNGQFDVQTIQETVTRLYNFTIKNEVATNYLTRTIPSYEDYLYIRSVNTCAIGTAILNRYNDRIGEIVNNYLANTSFDAFKDNTKDPFGSFFNYFPEDIKDMALGFLLHDIGNAFIPAELLNKTGSLTKPEFDIVKTHSYEKGVEILEKNGISNPYFKNSVKYHHSALFIGEKNCYPDDKAPPELPPYVKICKLADIYDAMTSRRAYKEASNPISVVTKIFSAFSNKEPMLQFILHSFLKIVGTYPAGSVLYLQNGQMCYVLTSEGPIVLPVTDTQGNPLKTMPDPIDLADDSFAETGIQIDRQKPVKTPTDVFDALPAYLRETIIN
jgi:response regulator RpfG family c-di-GMP phosphodiesterase